MPLLRRRSGPLRAALLLAFAALAPGGSPRAQPLPDPPFTLRMVAPGVYAAIARVGTGGNAGFVVGGDGVLVVDAFVSPKAAEALLAEIRKVTDKPVRYLVNTHYHIDHVGGDAAFKAAGATVIAHRNAPAWLRSENLHLVGESAPAELRARIAGLQPPDRTIARTEILQLGGRRIELRPLTGHTGGDLVVGVPDARVLFTGDIVWNHTGPTTIDGRIEPWTREVAQLEVLPGTTFVPGHGEVASAADLKDLEDLFRDLRAVTAEARAAGLSGEAVVSAAAPKLASLHPGWPRIDASAPLLVREMDQELAGTKRVPVPAP